MRLILDVCRYFFHCIGWTGTDCSEEVRIASPPVEAPSEPEHTEDGQEVEQPTPTEAEEELEQPEHTEVGQELEQPEPTEMEEELEQPEPTEEGEQVEQPKPTEEEEELELPESVGDLIIPDLDEGIERRHA